MSNELIIKEKAFNQIIQWLKDHNFGFTDKIENKKLESQTQFSIDVRTKGKRPFRLNIKFVNEYNDSFIINGMMALTDEDNKAFNRLKENDKKQIRRDIRKILYSLNLECVLEFPIIIIFKILTMDSINNNKQFFMDQFYNVLHGEQLIQIRFEEFFYNVYPKGAEGQG